MSVEDLKKVVERVDQVKNEVAAQSVQDEDFRDALLKDAKAAITEEYGLEPDFLKDVNIRIVEEAPGEIVMCIPPAPKEGELTDEQLEAVAGGVAFIAATAAVATGLGAAVGAGAIVQRTRAGRRW